MKTLQLDWINRAQLMALKRDPRTAREHRRKFVQRNSERLVWMGCIAVCAILILVLRVMRMWP